MSSAKSATGNVKKAREFSLRVSASLLMAVALGATSAGAVPLGGSSYQQEFGLAQCTMSPSGRNPFFVLEPGYQLVLEGDDKRLEITVLNEIKVLDGITTRIVEEREWSDGKLSEVARNYYAICEQTKDVFYFGEEVDFYENNKVTSHKGTWLAGQNGAKAGLMMPGAPKVGMKYYQEIAPDVAMDRAEIVSLDAPCKTPAGTFTKCLKTKEQASLDFWSSLKFWDVEYKIYAPGIGLVQDQELVLTKYGFVK